MKKEMFRYLKGFLAFAITLAILYLGQSLWQVNAVTQPLDKTLQSVGGVEKVSLLDSKKFSEPIKIDVTLQNAVNLEKTYDELNQKIVQALNKKAYVLEIKDNRTPELEGLYYQINYYVQKAIADGSFPQLAEKAQAEAKSYGASAKVYVDGQNVYLQLTKDGNSLYSIEPRHTDGTGGNKQ